MKLSIRDSIGSLEFFNNLSEDKIEKLISISSLQSYSSDRLLHYEKTENSKLLFLLNGLAKAYKIDKYDNEVFLYYIYEYYVII